MPFKHVLLIPVLATTLLTAQERRPPNLHQTIMSVEVALRELYGASEITSRDTLLVDAGLADRFQRSIGLPLLEEFFEILEISVSGQLAGYAVVSDEVGKFYPITFIVGVDPQLKIVGVRVLIYRESHGGDVKRGRFLRQYGGKQLGDPIAINRDIINISGATISVGALNRGVRKVLLILRAYGEVKR